MGEARRLARAGQKRKGEAGRGRVDVAPETPELPSQVSAEDRWKWRALWAEAREASNRLSAMREATVNAERGLADAQATVNAFNAELSKKYGMDLAGDTFNFESGSITRKPKG